MQISFSIFSKRQIELNDKQLEQIWIFNLKYLKLGQFGAAENLHTYSFIYKDLSGFFTLRLSGGIQKL